jgi:K+-transporting ATPase, C subunit
MLRRQLVPAVLMVAVLTVVTGLAYPLAVTGAARLLFADEANGSLVVRDGKVVGSSLIGQPFSAPGSFHPRPSAAGTGYDAAASSGTNRGPSNKAFLDEVADRVAAYRRENRVPPDVPVPVDAVTASASGLDPHISPANARLQAPRVAGARRLSTERVLALVDAHTEVAGVEISRRAGRQRP